MSQPDYNPSFLYEIILIVVGIHSILICSIYKREEIIESEGNSCSMNPFLLPDSLDCMEGTLNCTIKDANEIENGNLYVYNVDSTRDTCSNNMSIFNHIL